MAIPVEVSGPGDPPVQVGHPAEDIFAHEGRAVHEPDVVQPLVGAGAVIAPQDVGVAVPVEVAGRGDLPGGIGDLGEDDLRVEPDGRQVDVAGGNFNLGRGRPGRQAQEILADDPLAARWREGLVHIRGIPPDAVSPQGRPVRALQDRPEGIPWAEGSGLLGAHDYRCGPDGSGRGAVQHSRGAVRFQVRRQQRRAGFGLVHQPNHVQTLKIA